MMVKGPKMEAGDRRASPLSCRFIIFVKSLVSNHALNIFRSKTRKKKKKECL